MVLGFLTPNVVGVILFNYPLPNEWVDLMKRIAIALLFISVAYLNWRWLFSEEQPTPSLLEPLQARRNTPPVAIDDLDCPALDFLYQERELEEIECKCLNPEL